MDAADDTPALDTGNKKKKAKSKKAAAAPLAPAPAPAPGPEAEARVVSPLAEDVDADDDEGSNIIVQLKVGTASVDDADGGGRDPPDAYNKEIGREFEVVEEQPAAATASSAGASTGGTAAPAKTCLRTVELLRDFQEKSKLGEWPGSTSVCCYWCCHKFDGPPVGVPVKHVRGVFHVCGCFCSLECAMAHNYASNDGMDEIWERNSMLQLMGRRMGRDAPVAPAPNRLCLRMFGGHMDIDDFRKHCESRRFVIVNCPPMLSLTQQVEELYESDLSHDYKYVPLDHARVDEYRKKLRLKRNKPLINPKNTLDYSMNVTITT
jgi:hypothetical protein